MSNLETKDYTEYTQEGEIFALIGKTKKDLGLLQNTINQIEQKETKETKETKEDLELRKLTNLYLDVLGGDISKKDALIQQIIKTYSYFHKMEEKDFPIDLKKHLKESFNPSYLGKEESISLRALLENNGNPTILFCNNSKTLFGHTHYDPRDNTVNISINGLGVITNIIAEVAHAKQAKIRGDTTVSMATRQASDYIQHRKKDVYKQPGTLEYEAHTIIEPQLQREYSLNILNQVKNTQNLSPKKIRAIINALYISKNNKECEAMQKEFLGSFKVFYENNKKAIDTHGDIDIDTILMTLHHFDPVYIDDIRKIQYEIHGVSPATFDLCAYELEITKTFKIYDMARALRILFAKDTGMVSDKIPSRQNNPFINDQVIKKATDYLRKNMENIKNTAKEKRIEIFQILSPSENQKKMIHAYGLGWVFEGFDKDDMNFLMPQG